MPAGPTPGYTTPVRLWVGHVSMEMHQVRYFLAVGRTLNFTRAAEACCVTQPSLTRAIRQLEEELGGNLFRRERPRVQVTELGQRMLPLLQQCYDSAQSARSLASSIKSGEIGALRIALSETISSALLIPHLVELKRQFNRLELKLLRGNALEITELMKTGKVELAIASSLGDAWDRFDSWPLFTEGFQLVAGADHLLARQDNLTFADLRNEPLAVLANCEHAQPLAELLRSRELDIEHAHEVNSHRDLIALIEPGLGIAFVPRSQSFPNGLLCAPLDALDLRRTVFLHGIAGRQRTAVANIMVKMLRAANWSQYSS